MPSTMTRNPDSASRNSCTVRSRIKLCRIVQRITSVLPACCECVSVHTLEQKHIGLLIVNDQEIGVKNSDALSIIIRAALFALIDFYFSKYQRFIDYVQELINLDRFSKIVEESGRQAILNVA